MTELSTLEEIALRTGTDKATKHSYIPVYEEVVGHRRDEALTILEIGVNGTRRGASIRMWLEAFPNATVYGADVQSIPPGLRDQPRYAHATGDAYTNEVLKILGRRRYDLIVDDGPHLLSTQVFAVREYSQLLAPGGILIVEDVNLTHHPHAFGVLAEAVPDGFAHSWVDRRVLKGRHDDAMFIVVKQESR